MIAICHKSALCSPIQFEARIIVKGRVKTKLNAVVIKVCAFDF